MIVIGYLYNNNGMATWCFETAFALHEEGYSVLLVHSSSIQLPLNLPFKTLVFDFEEYKLHKGLLKRIGTALEIIKASSNHFTSIIKNELLKLNIVPTVFFLNQSNMVDVNVKIPQYVCSWVYPFNLKRYISSSFTYMPKGLKNKALALITAIGFYRKDAHGFKNASRVLAITEAMHNQLLKMGFQSYLLSPCCEVSDISLQKTETTNQKISIVISALDLENKRKNIIWLLQCLNKINSKEFEIILIGNAGNVINELVQNSPHTFHLKGQLNRNEALAEVKNAEVFLFASLSDDWGYVITEAMASGLAVLVPNKHPFNFIVGTIDYCFELNNENSFITKFFQLIITENLLKAKQHNLNRVNKLFSRKQFAVAAQPLLANL